VNARELSKIKREETQQKKDQDPRITIKLEIQKRKEDRAAWDLIKKPHTILIDGSYVIFRSYYSLQFLTNGAIYGYMRHESNAIFFYSINFQYRF
jgi:hypothetical protein